MSLGDFLRNEREKRGITLDQVASATKINIRILHALESDHYGDLPAKPFVRGFVMAYARFVGLQAHEILANYDSFLDEKAKERPRRDQGHMGYAFEKKETEQSRTWLWAILGGFGVILLVGFIFFKPKLSRHRHNSIEALRAAHATPSPAVTGTVSHLATAPTPPPANPLPTLTPAPMLSTAPLSVKPAPTLTPPSLVAAASGPKPTPKPGPTHTPLSADPADPRNKGDNLTQQEAKYKFILKAVDDVMVRYKVDGKATTTLILRKNTPLVMKGRQSIGFQVSDAKRVIIRSREPDFHPLTEAKGLVLEIQNPILVTPAELTETIKESFKLERPLSNPAPKPSRSASEPLSKNP